MSGLLERVSQLVTRSYKMHYSERRDLRTITGIIDAMIKGGASKVACAITYKAVVTAYSGTERARLKEAVEFYDFRVAAFKAAGLATYEDLARLVTSYQDLTDKNEELIAEQQELIGNYEKLVAKQQASLAEMLLTMKGIAS
tara:strand:+ start:630 stop:1055 length:426 start_codon:yes stop_codon:yes gene_type:complete